MTKSLVRVVWLAAASVMLASAGSADAQTGGGTAPSTIRPFPKGQSTGTTSGGTTSRGTTSGGSTFRSFGGSSGRRSMGFGFGQQATLTPEQELAVLMDTLTTVELILDSGVVQVSGEIEILFLLIYVYEIKRAEAQAAILDGGTGTGSGTGGITIPGIGTGTGTPTTP